MTTATKSATDLYSTSDTFRLLIDLWVRERRCPLPLVDLLLEEGMEAAADCARWAATTERLSRYGWPFPVQDMGGAYYWYTYSGTGNWCTHDVDPHLLTMRFDDTTQRSSSPVAALLWLLDHWRGR